MIDKIERLLRRFSKSTPKATYLKLLEQFDSNEMSIATLPRMLVEFWNRVDPNDFIEGPSFKEMLYVDVSLRHKTISELMDLINLATNAILYEDDDTIHQIAVNQFAELHTFTMDDYFAGKQGGSIEYVVGVRLLKQTVTSHGNVIENITGSYHSRLLNRLYNDLLDVTVLIIKQMKD